MTKINIGVVFGGKSPEHEVSKASAINIFASLDQDKYNIIPIFISKDGDWFLYDGSLNKLPDNIEKYCASVTLSKQGMLRIVGEKVKILTIDVAFSVIHGATGEDGYIQGLFEMAELPYVGCGVLASALCMDKCYTRVIAASLQIPITPSMIYSLYDLSNMDEVTKEIRATIGYPCFIKPSSSGSSLGTSKAKNKKEVTKAIQEALKYSTKVIVEKYVKARELECAVLGTGEEIEISTVGEIVTPEEFYTYTAKYHNPASKTVIPADISEDVIQKIREYSYTLFKGVGAFGLARIDFFLEDKTGKVIFNEINTMPGFTDISMYPKLIEHMGYSQQALLDKLIELAIYRSKKNLANTV